MNHLCSKKTLLTKKYFGGFVETNKVHLISIYQAKRFTICGNNRGKWINPIGPFKSLNERRKWKKRLRSKKGSSTWADPVKKIFFANPTPAVWKGQVGYVQCWSFIYKNGQGASTLLHAIAFIIAGAATTLGKT